MKYGEKNMCVIKAAAKPQKSISSGRARKRQTDGSPHGHGLPTPFFYGDRFSLFPSVSPREERRMQFAPECSGSRLPQEACFRIPENQRGAITQHHNRISGGDRDGKANANSAIKPKTCRYIQEIRRKRLVCQWGGSIQNRKETA